ncbi:nitronate monooxygenase family protein [Bosea sp. (in: a-proteobacteria)]|jgi:enoyl-[acyl-carrier protein] reductase II|uniref:NAD(P)H-dependent flavin oxidoreductase n=1 Tax=Bosea sp. (in: a-proteobacteria) TaxID=1871050 RepID=UPI002DDD54DA|nr:nitronate monooxygenase family protein [Bosea sp. (in: a-proteobacteria)]HEV2510462.1 nitronate monooxygenase family protein [Bosea sp. (in: a-proteobacteria)]
MNTRIESLRIETRFTRLVGIDLPIVQAGMSWASSCVALPAAVSGAGGLGVIAAGPMRRDDLKAAIAGVRAQTDRPFAVNVPLYRKEVDDILALLVDERVPVIIASQGGPDRYLDRFKAIGTLCLHVVASEVHAAKAAAKGVDGLVVVGGEAGGHPPPELVSTLVISRAVAKAVPALPIVLGGGIADGQGLAAALALGADAAQLGTRFMATPEACLHADYRRRVVAANVSDTMVVGRGFGMIRVLRNRFAEEMAAAERAGRPDEERRELFQRSSLKLAAFDGDIEDGKVEAGQSAGLIDDIVPASELVTRIAEEYRATLARLPAAHPIREPALQLS